MKARRVDHMFALVFGLLVAVAVASVINGVRVVAMLTDYANDEVIVATDTMHMENPKEVDTDTMGKEDTNEQEESPIIHIINTRFQQHQPNLTTLAMARLYLFKTVCLPSILQQTSRNFLWIIKVDPDIDIEIRNELIRYINEGTTKMDGPAASASTSMQGRIFVIGSNKNFGSGQWRGGKESEEVLSHTHPNMAKNGKGVYVGNVELLQSAQIAEPNKIVLETRLDIDDGLNKNFIRHVQDDALKRFRMKSRSPSNQVPLDGGEKNVSMNLDTDTVEYFTGTWFFWCAKEHIGWYPTAEGEYGQLGIIASSNHCITAGLTLGINIGTNINEVPSDLKNHAKIYKILQKRQHSCTRKQGQSQRKRHRKRHRVGHRKRQAIGQGQWQDKQEQGKEFDEKGQCVALVGDFVAAVRTRTFTSAGMKGIQQAGEGNQEKLWKYSTEQFHVSVDDAIEAKQFLLENQKEIARENLEGQCTKGHSCKEGSKNSLQAIVGIRI